MRVDCRNYESRTLSGGDSVRRCRLELAPEAPWRCPENCEMYSPRPLDLAWEDGEGPPPASEVDLDPAASDFLIQAESMLAEASATIRAEQEADAAKRAAKAAKRRPWKKRR